MLSHHYCINKKSGYAGLSLVIIVMGILLEIALASVFLISVLSNARKNDEWALRAQSAARSGIQDAELRIARDKDFLPSTYSLTFPQATAHVVIQKSDSGDEYWYTITASGSASSITRKWQATFAVQKATGLLRASTLREQAL